MRKDGRVGLEVKFLRKKILIIAVISVLLIAIPLAIASVTYQKTINVSGTANYPNQPATPDPTATPTASPDPTPTTTPVSISFSLAFENGTTVPATLTPSSFADFPTYNMWSSPTATGFGTGWAPTSLDTLIVTNTGNVPITITASTSNVVVPSNIDFDFQYQMLTSITGSPTTNSIPVGQTEAIMLMTNMAPTDTNYASNAAFTYSYSITITATQA